jgi:hypothetical protein
MEFTPIDYMTPTVDYLKSYSEISKEMSMEIDYMAIQSDTQQGYALVVVGANPIKISVTIARTTKSLITTVNLRLLLRRFNQLNSDRKATGDFFVQFADWIKMNEVFRGTTLQNSKLPMFSREYHVENGKLVESILDSTEEKFECMGGMEITTDVEQGVSEYDVQLKLTYETIYNIPRDIIK